MVHALTIVLLGFFLGMRHATDPDHIIAVTTVVSRQSTIRNAMLIGAAWGVGHTVTIFLVGGAIILFDLAIPPRLGLALELAVAVMLILLGILTLTGVMRWVQERYRFHRRLHGDGLGRHGHHEDQTPQPWLDQRLVRLGRYRVIRPLAVGVVHGLAGSAAVVLLVLGTIPNPMWATAYLLLFGIGTIAGMVLITAAIGVPFAYTAAHLVRFNWYLGVVSGVLSLGFGLFLVYQIGFVDGLFTSHPRWIPK
jgi:high-affinity nickel permease